MTQPKVKTISRGQGAARGRWYVDQATGDKLPSVTSITGQLPKPQIAYWRGKTVAQAAVDDFGQLADFITKGKADAAVDYLKRAPDRSSGKAAELGSIIHDLVDRHNKGEDLAHVHPEHRPFLDRYEDYIREFRPGVIESEVTVWSDTYQFAGTLDQISMFDDDAVLIDVKTGASGVWPDTALQLAAYARADCVINAQGERRPMPQIDGAAVLWLRPDKFELVPVRALDDDVFEVFLALQKVSSWSHEVSKTVLGPPLQPETNTQKEPADGTQ